MHTLHTPSYSHTHLLLLLGQKDINIWRFISVFSEAVTGGKSHPENKTASFHHTIIQNKTMLQTVIYQYALPSIFQVKVASVLNLHTAIQHIAQYYHPVDKGISLHSLCSFLQFMMVFSTHKYSFHPGQRPLLSSFRPSCQEIPDG